MGFVGTYLFWLLIISVVVAGLERAFPARPQQVALRPKLWSDLLFLLFNGHILGVAVYLVAARFIVPAFSTWLDGAGLGGLVFRDVAAAWPVWAQVVVALLVIDFLQWCVHNALHRIPALWEMHKCHHSVKDGEMDWIVAFRFQWTEVVVYRSVLYLPLAWFGFGETAVMVHAVFGTLIGHLNHANLGWDYGPLRYVLNSPRMHLWHHDYEGDERTTVNFGIIFSLWDWLFGTARMPATPPARLGFPGVEAYPSTFFAAEVWPLQRLAPKAPRWVFGVLGLGAAAAATYWVLVGS